MKVLNPYVIELAKTLNQHWYNVWSATDNGGKAEYIGCFPSATTILNAYPQSIHLTKWIADNGWNESQKIKTDAGVRGTRIHTATEKLEDGEELMEEEYSLEEWYKISTFVDWHNTFHPELIASEMSLFSPSGGYAGRLDRIYRINGEVTLLDIKSGAGIHDHFPLQFAAYAHAIEENTDIEIQQTAALQLGASNKNGYRFVAYDDWREHYRVFQNVHEVWRYGMEPKSVPTFDLPKTLKIVK